MPAVEAFAVLGEHFLVTGDRPVPPQGEPWVDGIDVLLRLTDGSVVVFGMRTAEYVRAAAANGEPQWGDYRPIPVTLDVGEVRFWDFGSVLWVGPAGHPCLVWSNAEAVSARAVSFMFGTLDAANLLAGPDGRGLPTPAQVGVESRPALHWRPVAHRAHRDPR